MRALPRWVAAVLVAVLAADVGALAHHSAAPAGRTGRTSARSLPAVLEHPRAAQVAAVRALLVRQSAAVLHRDRAGFLATVDPQAPAFRAKQARLFDDLAGVPIASWDYRVDPHRNQLTTGARFARYHAEVYAPYVVVLRYRLRGFDQRPALLDKYLTFVHRADGWYVGSDSDFADRGFVSQVDLWDDGPVVSVTGRFVLALGHPGARGLLRRLTAEADRDVPRVVSVWGTDWARRVVVVVPADQHELSLLVGGHQALDQIAAVATAELGGDHTPVGDRVLVNPANYAKLGPLGRQVVVTHEITHVATRAATGPMAPSWLVEGFADYVGFHRLGVDVATAAAELQADVRAGRVPEALPADSDFDGANRRLAQVYEMSWLACRMVAQRWGQAALVRLYRTVGTSTLKQPDEALAAALRGVLHVSTSTFVADWRAYLREQLS